MTSEISDGIVERIRNSMLLQTFGNSEINVLLVHSGTIWRSIEFISSAAQAIFNYWPQGYNSRKFNLNFTVEFKNGCIIMRKLI